MLKSTILLAAAALALAASPAQAKDERAQARFTCPDGLQVDVQIFQRPDLESGNIYTGFDATFSNIPASYTAGHAWHVHQTPVPAALKDGQNDCDATGGHLDPAGVKKSGSSYKCDPKNPLSTCEAGDWAGLVGNIVATSDGQLRIYYTSPDPAFLPTPYNLTQHSVVIHNASGTRICCGNITKLPTKCAPKPK
ncbi:Superoxide dismutase [Spiromyces aspiralis]|uniref:Superoxide dismutase n=1 Tax=Spiromyces aspiralis TaxID=68401 RepID=A0ACC1HUL1_9FUNG|nr:Superoxide dismutase [Spiromyces aspiralis]